MQSAAFSKVMLNPWEAVSPLLPVRYFLFSLRLAQTIYSIGQDLGIHRNKVMSLLQIRYQLFSPRTGRSGLCLLAPRLPSTRLAWTLGPGRGGCHGLSVMASSLWKESALEPMGDATGLGGSHMR